MLRASASAPYDLFHGKAGKKLTSEAGIIDGVYTPSPVVRGSGDTAQILRGSLPRFFSGSPTQILRLLRSSDLLQPVTAQVLHCSEASTSTQTLQWVHCSEASYFDPTPESYIVRRRLLRPDPKSYIARRCLLRPRPFKSSPSRSRLFHGR